MLSPRKDMKSQLHASQPRGVMGTMAEVGGGRFHPALLAPYPLSGAQGTLGIRCLCLQQN